MRIDILQPCFRFVAVPRFCSKRRSNELLRALSLPPKAEAKLHFASCLFRERDGYGAGQCSFPAPDQPDDSTNQDRRLSSPCRCLNEKRHSVFRQDPSSHIRVCEISHFQTHGFVSSSASKLTQRSQGWSAKRPSHRPRACRREMELNFRMFFIKYCNSLRLKLPSVVQFGLDEIAKPVALQIEMNVGTRIES